MNINYQSDFKIIERLMPDAPFRFTYYVAKDKGSVTAEYDGQSYSGCFVDGERLIVPVDGGTMGIGNVRVKREYFLDDKAFSDGVCNLVSVESTDIELGRGRTDSDIEADVEVGVYYKTFTFDDLTEEQKQEIADRVPTKEAEREKAEAQRVEAEKGRAAAEKGRADAEAARVLAEEERDKNYRNKVDRDDYASDLTAGFADNLVGRGEATPEEIGFRPSGGDTSIEDGTARIERLKGNTAVWNQFVQPSDILPTKTIKGITLTNNGDGSITANGTTTERWLAEYNIYKPFILGHIYALQCFPEGNKYGELVYVHFASISSKYDDIGYGSIVPVMYASKYFAINFTGSEDTPLSVENLLIRPRIYDLTRMFGAGNEPTTIEEFNARKPLGIDEYAYNEGELISTTADELKSVGFNAWDEEWEVGTINTSGQNYIDSATNTIRSKNYCRCLPNTRYYSSHFVSNLQYLSIFWYDADKNIISLQNFTQNNRVVTSPTNAVFFRIRPVNGYGTTYNHDICIHLVHTGYRNGEYEPYKEFRRSLPISEIKDSGGNALFPNGLLSAGSVYDEITTTKAIKRIGVVDMGSLEWNVSNSRFNSLVKVAKDVQQSNNVICYLYTNDVGAANRTVDKAVCVANGGYIYVYDTSYTDAATFKAAMSGVMLYYELAEPIEVDLPEPINMDYEVSDFGTEEVISDTPTTPLKADIVYQFNAVDRIRENSLLIEDLIKRVVALEAQNAALVQQLNSKDNEQTE